MGHTFSKLHVSFFYNKRLAFFSLIFLALGLPLLLLTLQKQQNISQHAASNGIPQLSHVFFIIMENHEYNQIIGSSNAPYINSLANKYGLATNYHGLIHPSLPNYIGLVAGSTLGISTDCTTCTATGPNIATLLETAGKKWKSYQESMPGNCHLGDAGTYAQRHNPFVYFPAMKASCSVNDVPYTQFASDLTGGNMADFIWITPNLQNDMHDGTIQQGDSWLAQEIPRILASSAYQNNGLLVITFDEGLKGSTLNQVPTLIISPLSKQGGFKSNINYNHYSLLRTLSEGLGIQAPAQAAAVTPMSDFFTNIPVTGTNTTTMPQQSLTPTKAISGQQPSPTPTHPAGTTTFSFSLCPHGLGNCGDSINHTGGNTTLQHTTRNVNINIFNLQNTQVATGHGIVSYVPSVQNFQGTATVDNLSTGQYQVEVVLNGFLSAKVPSITQVIHGQTISLPSIELTTGDINNDNQLDIIDYSLLISCFGSKQTSSSCTTTADINDDGSVDGVDYNLFLRELSVQVSAGSGSPTPTPTTTPTTSITPTPTNTPTPTLPLGNTVNSPYWFTNRATGQIGKAGNGINANLISEYKQLGIYWIRNQILWADSVETTQTNPPTYDWTLTDNQVQQANANGLHMVFVIQKAPLWHDSQVCKADGVHFRFGAAEVTQFATALAQRYNGKNGHGYIDAYEIGNEDFDSYYNPSIGTASYQCRTPEYYVPVLEAGYKAIKAQSPNALVGMFGMWWEDKQHENDFLHGMFQIDPQVGNYFDYGNFHFYSAIDPLIPESATHPTFDDRWQIMHTVFSAHGNTNKPIWVTETGWDNANPTLQNTALTEVMDHARQSGIVKKVFWYTINWDAAKDIQPGDRSIPYTFSPLPAFTTYQNYVKQYPTW